MEPEKLEKTVCELAEAEYEPLSAPKKRKAPASGWFRPNKVRTYETKVMTPDISTAVKEKTRE